MALEQDCKAGRYKNQNHENDAGTFSAKTVCQWQQNGIQHARPTDARKVRVTSRDHVSLRMSKATTAAIAEKAAPIAIRIEEERYLDRTIRRLAGGVHSTYTSHLAVSSRANVPRMRIEKAIGIIAIPAEAPILALKTITRNARISIVVPILLFISRRSF